MSFGSSNSNVNDSINRLTLLVNNLRHNQNLLIDYTIDNNLLYQQQIRTQTNRFNNSLFSSFPSFPSFSSNLNRTNRPTRNIFNTSTPYTNFNNMNIPTNIPTNITSNIPANIPANIPTNIPTNIPANMPANVEVSFIDSRTSDIGGPLHSIFNNLFGESRERSEILTFTEILNNTEIDLYRSDSESTEEPETCSICRDTISNNNIIRKIKTCGHYFHQTCLDNWLKEKNTCPNCRQLVVENEDDEMPELEETNRQPNRQTNRQPNRTSNIYTQRRTLNSNINSNTTV